MAVVNGNRKLFSRSFLESLPSAPPKKRLRYYDTRQNGLRVDITPSGRKTFQVYVKVEGRPVIVTLGKFSPELADSIELPKDCSHTQYLTQHPELNVRCARELAARVLIDLKSGTNPSDVKKAKRTEMTLGELFDEYVDEHLIPKKKRVDSAKAYYQMYVGELPPPEPGKKKRVKLSGCVNWHNRKISSITTEEIKRFVNGLATKGKSPDNANRVLTLLKSMYERARDWKLFKSDNPTDGISKFKTRSRQRFIQPDEAPRFFYSLSLEPNVDIRDYVVLSLLTGARKSNVHSMRWEDLNLERKEWTLPDVFTKNGDPLTIPLMPEAVEILVRRKPKKAAVYVFPGTGKSGHIENTRSGWDRVLDRDEVIQLSERINEAGGVFEFSFDNPESPAFKPLGVLLKHVRKLAHEMEIDTNGTRMIDLRPHDLRRTLGSWQASTGASLLMIGKTLGHRSQSATAIYAHLNIDPIRQSMETATSALLTAGGVKATAKVKPLRKVR